MATKELEKGGQNPVVKEVTTPLDIESQNLPKGYFLKPYFLGTLIASGLSMSAVGIFPCPKDRTDN